jgi:membrane protein implicated in regulation of membrane protease activity
MIWLLLLLIILLLTGALWVVLKIALGVALGVFLAFLAIAAFVWWRIRKSMNRPNGTTGGGGSSQITIDYRPD